MSDQNSLSAILAALAAQRPGTTPTQAQQQSVYQVPQQQAQKSYPIATGYSLPQPSSSGRVDLSNIKPVSSGSVRIEDAIAKAKAIAAEKGISYERPAAYSQPRSRSRSPAPSRRDAFRDNYNPYRDERRDMVAATRDHGRERSFSPGARGSGVTGTFSPKGGNGYNARERSPINRTEDTSEIIQIESSLVGLIIGKQGENLRRVESETGVRVQFVTGPDENGPYRQCKITGPRARRAQAKTEINRIVEENGTGGASRMTADRNSAQGVRASSHQPALREGEDSMQIMVPDRTVGLIIGRGGETIRDLQERSGCHVNIVGEAKSVNGLRPVNLIGSVEAAAVAKDLIMEIVESDSKSSGNKERAPPSRETGHGNYGGGGGGGGGGIGGGGGGGGGGMHGGIGSGGINDSIYVPSDSVGMIIGKGGETIKDIQNTTGCKINVSQSSGPNEVEREIGLVGTRESIERAKGAIMDKVEAVQQKNSGGGGGGRHRAPQNDYSERNYSQQSYGQSQGQPTQAQVPGVAGAEDPYAAYGGYQNYVNLWYQAMTAQQQAGQAQGDQGKPPGTS